MLWSLDEKEIEGTTGRTLCCLGTLILHQGSLLCREIDLTNPLLRRSMSPSLCGLYGKPPHLPSVHLSVSLCVCVLFIYIYICACVLERERGKEGEGVCVCVCVYTHSQLSFHRAVIILGVSRICSAK